MSDKAIRHEGFLVDTYYASPLNGGVTLTLSDDPHHDNPEKRNRDWVRHEWPMSAVDAIQMGQKLIDAGLRSMQKVVAGK